MSRSKILIPLLALLLAAALSCAGPAAPPPPSPATPTAAPLETPSSSPAPLSPSSSPLSPSPAAFILQQELYFSLGGGVSVIGVQGDCLELAPGVIPAIRDSGRNATGSIVKDYSSVCLYGFPLDQTLQVSVFRPDGSPAGSESFIYKPWIPGESFGFLFHVGDETPKTYGSVHQQAFGAVMELLLWLPPGLPEGEWRMEARAGSVSSSSAFTVSPRGDEPSLDLVFDPQANPLARPGIYNVSSGHNCPAYTAGEQARLSLSHLPPDRAFPIGLYRENRLVRQEVIASDSRGEAHRLLQILPGDPSGEYKVIAVLDLQQQDPYKAGPFACLYVTS